MSLRVDVRGKNCQWAEMTGRAAFDTCPPGQAKVFGTTGRNYVQVSQAHLAPLCHLPDDGQDHGGNQSPAIGLKEFNRRQ